MRNLYLGKKRWFAMVAVAVAVLAGWSAAVGAEELQLARGPNTINEAKLTVLGKLDTSLNLVPADAAFYGVMMRNREQFDAVANSNAVQSIKDMPIVKMLLMLYRMQGEEGPAGQVQGIMKDPQVKALIELAIDMTSHEIFFYGDESFVGFMKLLQEINAGNQFAPLAALADESDNPTRVQMAMLMDSIADNLDDVKIPDVVIGFKVKNKQAADKQLKKLQKLVEQALEVEPEMKGKFKNQKIEGDDFLVLSLDGEMIPWDEVPMEELKELEGKDGNADKILDHLKKQKAVIAIGVRGDFVLLSMGDSLDALKKLGKGPGLVTRPEMKKIEKFADQRIISIGYTSKAFNVAANAQDIQLEKSLDALKLWLPESGLPKKEQQKIAKDAAEFIKDMQGLLPEQGAAVSVSFLTKQGIEGYGYSWAKNMPFDGSKPLTLLNHLGGTPAMALVTRGKYAPENYDMVVKWMKVGWGYLEKYAMPEMDAADRKEFKRVVKMLTPLIEKADKINRELLIPAMKDGQAAMVLGTELKSKQFQKDLPATEKAMPMVEPAIVVGISDAAKLKAACAGYKEVFDGLLKVIRKLDPDVIPEEYKIPKPKATKSDAGEIFTYAAPKEWGLDKKIALTLGVSDKVGVIAASKAHAERLLTSTPPTVGGVLKKHDRPLAMAVLFDWAGLLTAAQPWIDLGVAQMGAASDTEHQANLDQAEIVVNVLKCLRSVTGETYFEDDVVVTHTLLEIKDVEPKKK